MGNTAAGSISRRDKRDRLIRQKPGCMQRRSTAIGIRVLQFGSVNWIGTPAVMASLATMSATCRAAS